MPFRVTPYRGGRSKNCVGTPEQRFWRRVNKTDGCWEWQGAKDRGGYGELPVGRRKVKAHRFSWELHCGLIPEGILVLHKCDMPGCVRPDHLFLGDQDTNMKDMVAKGRSDRVKKLKGEECHHAKLKASQVLEIRQLAANGIPQRDIAARFQIVQQTVSGIVRRKRWKDV